MEISRNDAIKLLVDKRVEVNPQDTRTMEEIAAQILLTGSAAPRIIGEDTVPEIRELTDIQ